MNPRRELMNETRQLLALRAQPREAMSESTCRLLIASESGIILASVELLIKNWNEFGEIAKTSLSSLASVAAKSPPDIILIPIPHARKSIVRELRQLSTICPRSRAVVLLTDEKCVLSLALLHAGAFGIISYRATPVDLRACLLAVREGFKYIDPQFTEAALGLRSVVAHPSREILSDRENEVLRLVALGHTQREVAAQLKVTARSVETYRSRIARKLQATSRADMVQFAIAAGLI